VTLTFEFKIYSFHHKHQVDESRKFGEIQSSSSEDNVFRSWFCAHVVSLWPWPLISKSVQFIIVPSGWKL